MSHGTGGGYTVVSAEELNRRAVRDARARCRALVQNITGAHAEARLLGMFAERPGSEPRGENLELWRAYETGLTSLLAKTRGSVAQAHQQIWAREIGRELSVVSSEVHLDIRPGVPRPEVASNRGTDTRAKITQSLEHALSIAATIEDDSTRDSLTKLAKDALASVGTDELKARSHLSILRSRVDEALRDQDRQLRLRRRADSLLIQMAGIQSDEAEALAVSIRSATTASQLESAEATLAEIQTRANAEDDRQYVVAQTAAALRRMGVQIGEDFVESALTGRTVIQPPSLPGYGIELEFQEGRSRFLTETIALTSDTRGDIAAQQTACSAVEELERELAAAGIQMSRYHTMPPGQVPMQRTTSQAIKSEQATRRRRRTNQQERGA